MKKIIENKKEEFIELFKNNSVFDAYLFGSVITDEFTADSDIDFIINFEQIADPIELGEKWWNIYYGLKAIFQRKIDIVNESTLTNPYFVKELNKTKIKIYG